MTKNNTENEFELENGVIFSPARRYLHGPDAPPVILTENNIRFLQLLLNGITDKESIINEVWKEQNGAISESSYYGQIYMLRKAFNQVGLNESLIHTIPRKGVRYIGSAMPLLVTEANDILGKNKHPLISTTTLHAVNLGDDEKTAATKMFRMNTYHRWKKIFFYSLTFLATCWLSSLTILIIIYLNK
ncbi:hypothetical protein NE897_10125 [Yersinia ruckeri]|uniref:Membrane protein n=1 Tax=Yersinia ruckeri TaxID=29486 RepID=A2IBY2_YERRU|nr:membrane protein [Yersinia ruckeri]ABM66821.1 ToxR-like protein [Yersinia ruckeri]AKA38254.1 membrane protein [Yersinia ruckeri]ARY99892.1 membrane protein [Yersinia ruckeri]AUQ42011.1 hypothetical protein NJ56_08885 [Yersinia ruckeri]EEP98664.1 hypothetical protein yruck0001_3230 [Yersinia ruckeri ATCC 29473]